MNIRQLRYFVSTVELGSVGAAAAAHFVTQPAVSVQLKRLGESVGEKLLERRGRRLVPTEAGVVLASRAQSVIASMEELERSMRGLRDLESGRLRLGSIDAASVYVLPDVYSTFHERYPQIKIDIMVRDTRQLLDALARGVVDLATTTLPIDDRELSARAIYREELVLVASPNHPAAGKRRLSAAQLASQGIISYPAGSTTRGLIDRVFAEKGLELRANMEISSPEAIKRLTEAGLGVSVLPRRVVTDEIARGSLVALRYGQLQFERLIGMVCRDEAALPAPARVFLDMVLERFPTVDDR